MQILPLINNDPAKANPESGRDSVSNELEDFTSFDKVLTDLSQQKIKSAQPAPSAPKEEPAASGVDETKVAADETHDKITPEAITTDDLPSPAHDKALPTNVAVSQSLARDDAAIETGAKPTALSESERGRVQGAVLETPNKAEMHQTDHRLNPEGAVRTTAKGQVDLPSQRPASATVSDSQNKLGEKTLNSNSNIQQAQPAQINLEASMKPQSSAQHPIVKTAVQVSTQDLAKPQTQPSVVANLWADRSSLSETKLDAKVSPQGLTTDHAKPSLPPTASQMSYVQQMPQTRSVVSMHIETAKQGKAALSDELSLDASFTSASQSAEQTRGTTTPTMPATVQTALPKHIAAQIMTAVVKADGRTVEVALSPEELGRVKISMSPTETGVAVSILSDRPETLDLMRRNIDLLDRDFAQMGFGDVTFDFGTAKDGKGDDQKEEPASQTSLETRAVDSATSELVTLQTATQGVDIRI